MTYWQTDPQSGELLVREGIAARPDPRTPDHWFLPLGAIIVAPPDIPEQHGARWTGAEWEVLEDWRGRVVWINGEPVKISELGPLPPGWSEDPPEPAEPGAREIGRAALATQWAALPAWIRGPFGATYSAAVALLDQGDDEAAAALILYADPPTGYTIEQVATFGMIRDELLAGIMALPPH